MNMPKIFGFLIYNIIVSFLLISTIQPVIADDEKTAAFRLKGIERGIFLPVMINDLQYTLLVDTGTTFTVLDSSFRPLLGKPLKETKAETTVGQTEVRFYNPVDIYAGKYNLTTRHQFLLSEFEFLTKVAGIKFHGILGMANLYDHIWGMNFDELELTIRSQPFEEIDKSGFAQLQITPDKVGIPTIPVEVGNEEFDFLIDSGDNGFGRLRKEIIDSLISQKLVVSVATDTTVSISEIAEVRRVRVKEVRVGENVYKNVLMRESLQNALGYGFLKQHHVIMDFPNREFWFKKGLGIFQIEREDKSGLKLISHNDQIVVAIVDQRGPAAKAGIQRGDIIVRVNDSEVKGADLFEVRTELKGEDGEEILFEINRSNENLDIQFNLKEGFDFIAF